MSDIYLNGVFLGVTEKPVDFVNKLRVKRRKGDLIGMMNVSYDEEYDNVEISTEKGRARRPLIVVKNGVPLLTKELMNKLSKDEIDWDGLVKLGVIEYLDANEEDNTKIAINESAITDEHTHLEISPLVIFGNQASLVPYAGHNMATRIIFGSKMTKQGLGIYASNYLLRDDTNAHIMHYAQKPLISTVMYDLMNYDLHPFGMNVVVAVMPWDGYNMEDSIVINKSSVDRGLFRNNSFKPTKCEELRYAGGIKDKIGIPDKDVSGYRTEESYAHLEEDGIIHPEAKAKPYEVLVGKTSPPRFMTSVEEFRVSVESRKETSAAMKSDENGVVDSVMITESGEGNKMVKVIIREEHIPELGDKFASRYGQKGIIGMTVPQNSMPFTASGVVPDIIFSPLSIPSRMTYAQVLECVGGKASAMSGEVIDATSFEATPEDKLRSMLLSMGFRDNGTEAMYDGRTGRMYKARIMIGNMFYMKLKYLVSGKIQARGRGRLQLLTRQPTEGRAKEGGLRLGEMEKDCLISHGSSLLLQERFNSDRAIIPICKKCGLVAIYNKFKNKGLCPVCGDKSEIVLVEMSYAFKLLLDELKSLCIYPQLKVKEKN
ncbi:MAG: DNA-directed RNA polymerase subunit B [Candidatus Nanoarchaeia archaeon]|jgi:DNA-directed RNA polymerase subunit B